MDGQDRQQLELLSDRALKQASEELRLAIRQLYSEHAAKGVLGSGATIKAGVRLMSEIGGRTMARLLQDCGAVSNTNEAFDHVVATIGAMLDGFSQALPDIIHKASRAQPSGSINSAALDLFRKMRSDLEADLLIARHGYLQPSVGKARSAIPFSQKQNVGGKPLAEHWDAMWSAIAVQLWTGDLRPKTQADVKDAMFAWFNANGIEIGDTAVTQRARQLWQAMEATES